MELIPQTFKKRFGNDHLLVAVSGGVDSIVLLHSLLTSFAKKQLIVAHYDHNIRKESASDAEWVKDVCKAWGVRFIQGRNPKSMDRASESHLRALRRSFLERTRNNQKCQWIVTAHHLEDQWETFCMRLMRGTSPVGIRSMTKKRGVWLKPLLNTSREQILDYAKKQSLQWRDDSTNSNSLYLRNRIRNEVSPLFFSTASSFGSKTQVLKKTHRLLQQIEQLNSIAKELSQTFTSKHVVHTPFWIRFPRKEFSEIRFTYLQRLILKQLAHQAGKRKLTHAMVNQVLAALKKNTRSCHLGEGLVLSISCGQVFLQSFKQIALQKSARIDSFVSVHGKLPDGYTLRFPQPGDRIRTTKFKKILLEKRIPQPERAVLPVISSGTQIEWFWQGTNPTFSTLCISCAFPFSFYQLS